MRRFVKAVTLVLAGALLSAVLYPLTHGDDRKLPEVVGLAAGCVLIDTGLWWLFCDWQHIEKAVGASFVATALVGLGVALNRAGLELREAAR